MLKASKNGSPVVRILYDVREAAMILRVSVRAIWRLTAEGKIRAVRLGRSVFYDIADLLNGDDQPSNQCDDDCGQCEAES